MEETLGMRISELRREKGLKQDEVAERLGVSAQAVSKWENDVSCPDILMLPKLANLFDISVDELLSDGKKAPETKYCPPEVRKNFDELVFHVRVDDSDGTRVRINLPMPLFKLFLETGMSMEGIGGDKLNGINIDFEQIMTMVENGAVGRLVEIDSDGTHVEIGVD